jgi:hypothetical protein
MSRKKMVAVINPVHGMASDIGFKKRYIPFEKTEFANSMETMVNE